MSNEIENDNEQERTSIGRWVRRLVIWGFLIFAIVKWPQGVGAIVAGLAIFGIVIYYWVRHKLNRAFKGIGEAFEGLAIPPLVKLIPLESAAIEWNDADRVRVLSDELEGLGFDLIGEFGLENGDGIYCRAFLHAENRIYATVNDSPVSSTFIDLVSDYEDDGSITYSNNDLGFSHDRPKNVIHRRFEELDTVSLYELFLKDRPEDARALTREAFVSHVEEYSRKHTEWAEGRYEREEELRQELKEAFLEESGWPALEWDRKQYRVVIVHDEMQDHEVMEHYTDVLGDLHEDDDAGYERDEAHAKATVEKSGAIDGFAEIVITLPDSHRFEKLAELAEPVVAHVYLAPEMDEE